MLTQAGPGMPGEAFLQSLLVSALLLVAELAIRELMRRFGPSPA
jgi:hypothetical protein